MKNKTTVHQTYKKVKRAEKINTFKGVVLSLVVLGFIGFSIKGAVAEELTQSTVSYGNTAKSISDTTRKNVINSHKNNVIRDQVIGKALNKSREEVIANKKSSIVLNSNAHTKNNAINGITKSYSPYAPRYYAPEFSVYDAVTYLEDDYDADGYYRTFSVVFDADVYNPNGYSESMIYAELYISTDGENWTHYYTTDDFIIQADGDEDAYEVITTFTEGYAANHYDILIDIYEVGYSDIVATYSSYDNNSLYALPLESADYDQVYVEEVIVHGGSNSTLVIMGLILILGIRAVIKSDREYARSKDKA